MNENILSYKSCTLCARNCRVDRDRGKTGFCHSTSKLKLSRAALHFWEEPCISGSRGSGTIFFSGCSLGCIYCQNKEISRGNCGIEADTKRLSEIMLELEQNGAHNVNLVTPTHFVPHIIDAVKLAKSAGLSVPVIYNTGSYENEETISALNCTVDVFLPDLKYYRGETAKKLSAAEDLPVVSRRAIGKMVEIAGDCRFDEDGMITGGVIVRILLLPGHLAEAKLNLKYLYETYGDRIYVSLMSQYTPSADMPAPLNRRVTQAEYRELVNYAITLGVKNAYTQEFGCAEESFIPPFDNTGVLKNTGI